MERSQAASRRRQVNMLKRRELVVFLAMAAAGVQSATASTINGQQIIATFGGIVVAGFVANDPVAGQTTYLNNTGTAAFNITNDAVNNNIASSSLSWGVFTGTNTGFQPFSDLVFVGNNIPSTHASTPFNI